MTKWKSTATTIVCRLRLLAHHNVCITWCSKNICVYFMCISWNVYMLKLRMKLWNYEWNYFKIYTNVYILKLRGAPSCGPGGSRVVAADGGWFKEMCRVIYRPYTSSIHCNSYNYIFEFWRSRLAAKLDRKKLVSN